MTGTPDNSGCPAESKSVTGTATIADFRCNFSKGLTDNEAAQTCTDHGSGLSRRMAATRRMNFSTAKEKNRAPLPRAGCTATTTRVIAPATPPRQARPAHGRRRPTPSSCEER